MKRMTLLVSLGVIGAMIVLLNASFLFILLAIMPSIVAYYVDTNPRKLAFKVVLAGNISASLPSIMPLIKSSMHVRKFDLASAMMDPKVWMFIYLGAAAGWALIYLCKYVARFVVAMSFEYNIRALENMQKMLIEEWGHDISNYKDTLNSDE